MTGGGRLDPEGAGNGGFEWPGGSAAGCAGGGWLATRWSFRLPLNHMNRNAARMPPSSGPTMWSHMEPQMIEFVPEANAGPSERAGLAEPPVQGPAKRTQRKGVPPMSAPESAAGRG